MKISYTKQTLNLFIQIDNQGRISIILKSIKDAIEKIYIYIYYYS